MGKYLIRVESMDMDKDLDQRYADGIDADCFCIVSKDGDKVNLAIHGMSIDTLSDTFTQNSDLLASAVLAKAKKDVVEICKRSKIEKSLKSVFGVDDD